MTKKEKIIRMKKKHPKMTHQEIANRIGVDRVYVTHALNNPSLTKRIEDIEKRLTHLEKTQNIKCLK